MCLVCRTFGDLGLCLKDVREADAQRLIRVLQTLSERAESLSLCVKWDAKGGVSKGCGGMAESQRADGVVARGFEGWCVAN